MKWYGEEPLISCVGTVNFHISLNIVHLDGCEEWFRVVSRWLGSFFESQFMRNGQLHKIHVTSSLDRNATQGWRIYSTDLEDTLGNLLKSIPKRENIRVELDPVVATIKI